jgi:hypothetical protein
MPHCQITSPSCRNSVPKITIVTKADSTIVRLNNVALLAQDLVTQKTGSPAGELAIDPNPPWLVATTIPQDTQEKAAEFGATITQEQWAKLSPLQRFALIKLSRPSHENHNFLPALKEFDLIN